MGSDNFEILHDCVLHDLRYDLSDPTTRTLSFVLECPVDLGKDEWNGRTLRFTAVDVFLFRLTAWGHCWGHETLDAWRAGVSDDTRSELDLLPQAIDVPSVACTWSFHSGSYWELVCQRISVEIVEKRQASPPVALKIGS